MTVRGRVIQKETGEGMSGIAVSNGWAITLTRDDGAFELDVDLTRYPFVFLNTPSGFRPADSFYRRIDTPEDAQDFVQFDLIPDPSRRKAELRLAAVSDAHIVLDDKQQGVSIVSTEEVLQDLSQVIRECRPDFIVNTGDLTSQGTEEAFAAYKAAVDKVGLPVMSLVGNHDMNESPHPDSAHLKSLGPDQYSFDWGPFHFVVYPWPEPENGTREKRFDEWFRADLARQTETKKVVVVAHGPPGLTTENKTTSYSSYVPREVWDDPRVILVLHGHYHTTRVLNIGSTTVVSIPCLTRGTIDTNPRGYALIDLAEDDVKVTIRALRQTVPGDREPPPALFTKSRDRALRRKWTQVLPCSLHRSEAIEWNARILLTTGDVGDANGYGIWCLEGDTGEVHWHIRTDSVAKTGPAVSPPSDNQKPVGVAVSVAGRVYGFEPNSGNILWERELSGYPNRWLHSRPVINDGKAIVVNRCSRTALDLYSGSVQWHHNEPGVEDDAQSACHQSPVALNGRLLFVRNNGKLGITLVTLSLENGEVEWEASLDAVDEDTRERYPKRHMRQCASVLRAGDKILSPGFWDHVALFSCETGKALWQNPLLDSEERANLSVAEMGAAFVWGFGISERHILATTADGYAYAIDRSTGQRIWRTRTCADPLMDMVPHYRGTAHVQTHPVQFDNLILTGGSDGYLVVLDPESGDVVERFFFDSPITVPPLVTDRGIGVFTFDGQVTWYEPFRDTA